MIEKFTTQLEWHQINLDQIYQLLEAGELVRGAGLACVRLEGIRERLADATEIIDNSGYETIKEEQSLKVEIGELERLVALIN